MIKQIPLFKVFMSDAVDKPLLETLHSGFIGEGPRVIEFENSLKKRLKTDNVLAVNSGTSALHLAYHMALNCDPNKHTVFSTPMTCTATNNPIIHNGGDICWVDVDPITGNITPETLLEALNSHENSTSAAITVVHWGGNPCELDKISKIAAERNIVLIEDGAHALGMKYNDKPFGYYSDFAMHSFQAIKHITSGDGGCLICKNKEDYKKAKLLRWYGIDRDVKEGIDLRCELDILEPGYKFHMNDLAATIGKYNLDYLDRIVEKHRDNAIFYNSVFDGRIKYAKETENGRSPYWLYTIHVNNRDELMSKLKEKGIMTSKVHSRTDTHSAFKESRRELPGVESFGKTHLCIPVGWWVTKEDREYIAEQVIRYAK